MTVRGAKDSLPSGSGITVAGTASVLNGIPFSSFAHYKKRVRTKCDASLKLNCENKKDTFLTAFCSKQKVAYR
jgi:hypothetical protein